MLPLIEILNPNTSPIVSALLLRGAVSAVAGRARIVVRTAPFGAPAIACDADLALAEKAVARMVTKADHAAAIVIGAFGDPGLAATRYAARGSVAGIGEAGLRAVGRHRRFDILTLGPGLDRAIRIRVSAVDPPGALDRLTFLDAGIADVAAAPERYHDAILEAACQSAARGIGGLLLGGAPFSGLGPELSQRSAVPIYDGTSEAVRRLFPPS